MAAESPVSMKLGLERRMNPALAGHKAYINFPQSEAVKSGT
jgi:hypothetical protein